MSDDRIDPNETHEASGPQPLDPPHDHDELLALVFDERPSEEDLERLLPDPASRVRAAQFRELTTALRSIEPPPVDITERNIDAALAAWDELSVGSTAAAPRRALRSRRWSFAPAPAWLGAAAAVVIVVAAGAMLVDLGSRGSGDSTDATPSLLDSTGDDVESAGDTALEMFAIDDSMAEAMDADADRSLSDHAADAADEADIADDADAGMGSDGASEVAPPSIASPPAPDDRWPRVGAIEAEALDEIVTALLPGVAATADDRCTQGLDHIVAAAELAGRTVLLGTAENATQVVAIDVITCELLASAPLP